MVVIFGHTGFIGGELWQRLERAGAKVAGISTKQCDLLDQEAVRLYLADLPRPFAVVNCAVINKSSCHGLEGLEKNLQIFRNIMVAIPAGACRSFIQLSSVDVYGHEPALPITEHSDVNPATDYAKAKLACERMLSERVAKEFPVAVLRLPGVYGPGDQGRSLIGSLLRKTFNHEPIALSNGGMVLRDYLLIDDLSQIVKILLDAPRQLLVNLVSGQSKPLREILAIIFEQSGMRSDVIFPLGPVTGAADLVFDNRRCRDYFPGFGFTCMREGIMNYANGYQVSKVTS
jgi:nucleoside-diphosphate-sugar epimerase